MELRFMEFFAQIKLLRTEHRPWGGQLRIVLLLVLFKGLLTNEIVENIIQPCRFF